MYLHLGQETVVRIENVVGIFDIETTTLAKSTRKYLFNAQKNGKVINVSMEMPKSFVLCCNKKKQVTIYITQISSSTLLKRTGFTEEISNLKPGNDK
jgi:extracellular matrix regulatory protein B